MIRRWLILMLINGVFGGSSDQVLTNIRNVLRTNAQQDNFPYEAINTEILRMGNSLITDQGSFSRFLSKTYPNCVFELSLLYDDFPLENARQQIDHIFPKALFSSENLSKHGISPEKQETFNQMLNWIGNLELLLERENNEKRAKPIDVWLTTRDQSFYDRHLLPKNDDLLKIENFEEFIKAREKLILERLGSIITFDPY